MSYEKYLKLVDNSIILVAYDAIQNKLIGTVTLSIREDRYKWAYMDFLAIANNVKNSGVATKLFEKLMDIEVVKNCKYISSITSVKAISSIKWHLKNGFKIVGYRGAGVYTYLFMYILDKNMIYSKKYYLFFNRIFTYIYGACLES